MLWGSGDFEELKNEGIAKKITRLRDDLPLGSEPQDGVLVLARSKAEKEAGFFLALELGHGPFVSDGLLLVEAAFQWVFDAE